MRKQKQQPFFVKRVRLRKSIIKTHQLLETMSINEIQSNKQLALTCTGKRYRDSYENRHLSTNGFTVDSTELYSSNSHRYNTKNVIKIFSVEKDKDIGFQMNKAGLQIKGLKGNIRFAPKVSVKDKKRKQAQSSENLHSGWPQEMGQGRSQQRCSIISPQRKNREYLYKKMANMQVSHWQQNHVYEKRIKSYTQFLWKCMLAHNIYINLDLEAPTLSLQKRKAFVGFGNNCNMIKGLIKRRFWWTISEELTEDCVFVWTQIKINKIYERQEKTLFNLIDPPRKQVQLETMEDILSKPTQQRRRNQAASALSRNHLSFESFYAPHNKIWNKLDYYFLKEILKKKQFQRQKTQTTPYKQKSYFFKTKLVSENFKPIALVQIQGQSSYAADPIIHNHLQNNFFLGNKKALFYNLRQYYGKIGQEIFDNVPLTFHIRQGLKDPEYIKFIKFYNKRAKMIAGEGDEGKKRNIWIVKPGQNSNQGQGIVVIDQIYELDRIIKQSSSKNGSNEDSKTFIVQLYIDRPFLYNQRKFDIRHYMLITNLFGVTRAYWYEEGYIRTSAYLFDIHSFEPQIHLTNDAIQRKYPQYGRYQPFNKISYSEFQNYLNSQSDSKKYNFKQTILREMKRMGRDAARSVCNKISPQNQMHNFQIFGLDFMIDRNFKPWLIEINTNPCLDCSCPLLDRIIPYMVEQAFKLTLDIVYPPPTHYPKTTKHFAPLINLQTFKYQLIFDSLSEGQQLKRLFAAKEFDWSKQIGVIDEQEEFKEEGREIKLQDYT